MPALSENFNFIRYQDGQTNYTTSTVSITYSNTATNALIYTSDKVKGDGYFSGSDGLHTAFWNVSNFKGTISIQGSLSTSPQENDWADIKLSSPNNSYTVDTTGLISAVVITAQSYTTSTTAISTYNFTGNFVWLRAQVRNFTQGTVNVISINR
jgi:hypothetical protein